MGIIITFAILLFSEAVVLVLDCIVAGVAALAGASFRKVFQKGLWSLLLFPSVFVYGMIECHRYEVKTIEIQSDELPASFDGYKIVQISDVHLDSFRFRRNSLAKAVDKINSLAADAVVMTGDLVTFNSTEINDFKDILSGIEASDGVFSVMGNHDYCTYSRMDSASIATSVERLRDAERDMHWTLLSDDSRPIVRCNSDGGNDTISIIGVENISASEHFPSIGDLNKAMKGSGENFKVLLSHDPTHWRKEVVDTDIDLTLSGHTHCMQFSMFGWTPCSLLYKEYRGLYENASKNGTQYLYVNIGLGETGFPVRIGSRPEITELILRSKSAVDTSYL